MKELILEVLRPDECYLLERNVEDGSVLYAGNDNKRGVFIAKAKLEGG